MDLSFMNESMGRTVRLERGGPDKVIGKLLHISSDYLAVETDREGVMYVNARHIKTLSEPIIPEVQMTRSAPIDSELPEPLEERPPLVEAEDFQGLLSKLETRLVRVNHGGPNSLQGVLMKAHPGYITLLHDMQDYVHYPTYHIKSITWIMNTQDSPQGEGKKNAQKGDEKGDDKGGEGSKHKSSQGR